MIDGFYAVDAQVHSSRSHDGRATIREQCARAVAMGLDVIGFSEHKDFDPQDPVVGHFDYQLYLREIEEARLEFGDRLAIRMGVEVDYQKWSQDDVARYLDDHPFDFVIGSVHYVDRVTIMSPEYRQSRSREEAYRLYYQAVRDSVASGLFDIVGHLEYANRRGVPAFGPFDPTPYREQVADLLGLMIEREVALEINTAGLRQGTGATYPCEEHVALYASLGGRLLSIGSDSHHPDDLAADYAAAASIALRSGLEYVHAWENRKPSAHPLAQAMGRRATDQTPLKSVPDSSVPSE